MTKSFLFFDNQKKILSVFFGITVVLYILYIRIIKTTLPKDIYTNLYTEGNYILLIIYALFLFLSLYLFWKNIKKFFGLQETINNNFFFTFFNYVVSLIKNGLKSIDFFIKEVIFNQQIGEWLTQLSNYLYKKYYNKQLRLFIFFFVFPRISLLIAMLIDVFIFKQFFYVYKISFLLLMPLLGDYLFYTLENFWTTNKEELEKTLSFYYAETEEQISMSDYIMAYLGATKYKTIKEKNILVALTESFLEENKHKNYDAEATTKYHYNNFCEIVLPCALFELKHRFYYKERLSPYLFIVIHCMYIIIWSYVLIYCW